MATLVTTLVLTAIVIAVCFIVIGLKIFFHPSHKFPETSAGHNPNMRKLGIMCPKVEDAKLHGGTCPTCYANARTNPMNIEE